MKEIQSKREKLAKPISFGGVAVLLTSGFFVDLNKCYHPLSRLCIFLVNYLNVCRNYFWEKLDTSESKPFAQRIAQLHEESVHFTLLTWALKNRSVWENIFFRKVSVFFLGRLFLHAGYSTSNALFSVNLLYTITRYNCSVTFWALKGTWMMEVDKK